MYIFILLVTRCNACSTNVCVWMLYV